MSNQPKSQYICISGRVTKKEEKNIVEYNITIQSGDIKNIFSLSKNKSFSDIPVGAWVSICAASWKGESFIMGILPCPSGYTINQVDIYGYPILVNNNSCVLATELGNISCTFNCKGVYEHLSNNEGKQMRFWGELHNNTFYIKGGSNPL